MKLPIKNPGWAAVLSFLLPGLGQFLGGKPGRGALISLPAIVLFFVLIPVYLLKNHSLVGSSAGLTSLLIIDVVGGLYHLYAVIDAYREIKPIVLLPHVRGIPDRRNATRMEFAALVGVLAATVAMHGYVGYADLNSCTMRNVPCPVAVKAPVAAGSPAPQASGVPNASGVPVDAGASATPASPSASTYDGPTTTNWKPIADRLRVHSKPSSTSSATYVLREWQTITGTVVAGEQYPFGGEQHTEWIKIDRGQPGAGGYVAGAYFLDLGQVPAPATPTPKPTPTPTATPKSTYTPNV